MLATPDVAAALGVDVGSALIALTRVVYDAKGRGVEHLAALYRPDRYAFRMDLVRTGDDDGRRWSPVAAANADRAPTHATATTPHRRGARVRTGPHKARNGDGKSS